MVGSWVAAACVLVGCFWMGAALGAGIAAVLGFWGGFMWSGLLGRRDARSMIERLIDEEAVNVAACANRSDIEEATRLSRRVASMADELEHAVRGKP